MGQSAHLTARLADARATRALGTRLAHALGERGAVIGLAGELGAGKTTLVRGLLRRLGVSGRVRSPTYALVEPYEIEGRLIHHIDLYRVSDPEELEYLGLRDLTGPEDLLLVEWPERAPGLLPALDVTVLLEHRPPGRQATLVAHTARGRRILASLPEE